MNFKRFLKENGKSVSFNGSILLFINLYFYVLGVLSGSKGDIYYLNFLLLVFYAAGLFVQYHNWKRKYHTLYELARQGNDIDIEELKGENLEEEILRSIINRKERNYCENLESKKEQIKELEEYLSRWVHEIKLPISTLNMMLERIEDDKLNSDFKNEIEKIKFLVNSVLYGSRATAAAEDISISEFQLQDIVKQAIKNNAFMLIRNNMEVKLENLDYFIFSDKKWILYVLDQLIHNAVKYAKVSGTVEFYGEKGDKYICLNMKDYGIGIAEEDIDRIFKKGFTGSNGRNTTYKSTGMGLYFTKKILDKLGNSIEVESVQNQYTLFKIKFNMISDFVNMTKM